MRWSAPGLALAARPGSGSWRGRASGGRCGKGPRRARCARRSPVAPETVPAVSAPRTEVAAAAPIPVVHHVDVPGNRQMVVIDVHEARGIVDVVVDVGIAAAAAVIPSARRRRL